MSVDWDKTINEILAGTLACQACEALGDEMIVGYTRSTEAAEFAARCQDCTDKSDCDARKLVVVCESCAGRYRVNGQLMTEAGWMGVQLDECRRNLEESLDYLAEYWRDEFDLAEDELDRTLEQVDLDAFRQENEWRRRHEEEYLRYHREFRARSRRIPQPGWRSEYVEEIRALGYDTVLGD